MLPRPSVLVSRAMPAAIAVLLFIFSLTYLYRSPGSARSSKDHVHPDEPSWSSDAKATSSALTVEYDLGTGNDGSPASEFCNDRFSAKYLDNIRGASFQYCNASSPSSFTCFHSHTTDDDKSDSLCITQGTLVDLAADGGPRFAVDCDLQQPGPDDAARGVIPFESVRQYWYDTGPKFIIDNHFDFDSASTPRLETGNAGDASRLFTLLVKREGEANPWHCLMEIWSMTMAMDVLRTTVDPGDPEKRPYFRVPEDVANLQVVILDDRADGPYFDLWKMFSGREPIRLNQIRGNPEAARFFNNTDQRVILPLAGATNPVWQNDWTERDCTRSDTLRVFVRRVLEHYGVSANSQRLRKAVRVTVIDRKGANTRRLINQAPLLDALRAQYPYAEIQTVDFGAMSFAEQLTIARDTDVLVGIHGAGLTHAMFLREQAAAVVEIQPSDMENVYMGFRNIAAMRGVSYFRAVATPVPEPVETGAVVPQATAMTAKAARTARAVPVLSKRASWHTENFEMDSELFVQAVGEAIEAIETVYSK